MLVVRSSGRVVVSTSVVVPLLVVLASAIVVLVIDIVSLTKEAMIVLVGPGIVAIRGSSESTADPPLSAESTADLDPPLSAAYVHGS